MSGSLVEVFEKFVDDKIRLALANYDERIKEVSKKSATQCVRNAFSTLAGAAPLPPTPVGRESPSEDDMANAEPPPEEVEKIKKKRPLDPKVVPPQTEDGIPILNTTLAGNPRYGPHPECQGKGEGKPCKGGAESNRIASGTLQDGKVRCMSCKKSVQQSMKPKKQKVEPTNNEQL